MYAIRQIHGKRRGLVATETIPAGTEIATCPVVVYDWTDAGRIQKTRLGDYNFRFGERGQLACIVLGVISLCNHADSPNAEVICHEADEAMTLVSIRDIGPGEEICIRYRRTLWFTPAAQQPAAAPAGGPRKRPVGRVRRGAGNRPSRR